MIQTRYDEQIKSVLEQYYFFSGKTVHPNQDLEQEINAVKPEQSDFDDKLAIYVSFCNTVRAIKDYYLYSAQYNTRSEALERAFMEWKQCVSKQNKILNGVQGLVFGIKAVVLKRFSLIH